MCTCDSLDLFKGGCQCGSLLPQKEQQVTSVVSKFWVDDIQREIYPALSIRMIPITTFSPTGGCYGSFAATQAAMNTPALEWNIPCNLRSLEIFTLSKWLPGSDYQRNTTWMGVDRSQDPIRLSGIRWQNKNNKAMLDEIVFDAAYLAAREGANPTHGYCNEKRYNELFPSQAPKASIAVTLTGAHVNFFIDNSITHDRIYLLDLATWKYDVANQIVYCTNPGANVVIVL